jgi:2-phospho-L-lactate transferase/gluconeogenesis factor (CofD/UPF0052 family)
MNIVCIDGGHGLSQVLSALKTKPCSLIAIVTTTDNGGSTGRLSQIALGDIRRCVVHWQTKIMLKRQHVLKRMRAYLNPMEKCTVRMMI